LPFAAGAQQPAVRVYRLGYLAGGSRDQQLHLIFEEGLRSIGYRVGENVVIEYRFADGEVQRFLPLLVRLGVDIIVCGNHPSTVAAMKVTRTRPIK
jgi:putative tryptophan/tyrosine transport system substrate-binding protein